MSIETVGVIFCALVVITAIASCKRVKRNRWRRDISHAHPSYWSNTRRTDTMCR